MPEPRESERAENEAVANAKFAASHTDNLGPGTAGYTTSGAAYRGKEIASVMGTPSPAEPGFTTSNGLGYVDEEGGAYLGFAPAERPGK